MSHFDVVIIGSGPSGLFTALTLAEQKKYKKIVIIDRARQSSGGMANDGKLNFHTKVGMSLSDLQIDQTQAELHMKKILDLFLQTDCLKEVTKIENENYDFWTKRVANYKSELIIPRQFHYGTDNARFVIDWFKQKLEKQNVEFMLETKIIKWEKHECFHLETDKGEKITSDFLVVGCGRWGAYECKKNAIASGVNTVFGPIDVGIRVEMNADFYNPIVQHIYDPKIILNEKRNVRTFCTNPNGRVRTETYDEFKLVNGDALSNEKTKNTNFALLRTVRLTEPLVDTTAFARMIASQFNLLSGGNEVIVQRIANLREGRRSRQKDIDDTFNNEICKPTLETAISGDVTLGFPSKIWHDLWQSLKTLDKICPSVLHPSTLIYAPEIKFYDTQYSTNQHCETNIKNLYMIGDGCGKSRGIVGAALSGILAGEGVLKK